MKARKTTKMSASQVAKLKVSSKKKWLSCTKCGKEVQVDEDTIAVTCSSCTMKLVPGPKTATQPKQKSDKPAGWRFMTEFVDKDGNVFYFGEEQPELKGTKEPSDVTKIKEEQKKKRKDTKKKKELREQMKIERLAKQHEKKMKAKKKAEEKKQKKIKEILK